MRLYLASLGSFKNVIIDKKPLYILETFFQTKKNILYSLNLVGNENFLLDSGAFTFMNSYKGKITEKVINNYLTEYINFIKENNIKYFFNLDLDTIIGVDKTEELRKKLESEVGKKCIPVFHKIMGLDKYINLCKNYNYIAIGTIQEFRKYPLIIKKMNKIAKKYNCKVHGLGFTPKNVEQYGFYSVDSTSWLNGPKFGKIQQFNGKEILTYKKEKCRAKDYKQILKFNLKEYIKYQEYLDRRQ